MRHPDEREEILYSFAVEERHDRETLERYLKLYPDLVEDLVDLSSELRMHKVLGPARDDAFVDTNRDAAWAQFLASGPCDAADAKGINPFARFQGAAFVQLAKNMNMPRSMLTPLCDGLVAAASIPEPFLQRLAQNMGESLEVLRVFFARAEPQMSSLSYKADEKPSVQGQMTFREYVLATDMTEDQRKALLQDCDDDGRN